MSLYIKAKYPNTYDSNYFFVDWKINPDDESIKQAKNQMMDWINNIIIKQYSGVNKTLIWLDDMRNPNDPQWKAWLDTWSPIGRIGVDIVWLKSFKEFKLYLLANSWPDAICYDHDLGEGPSGYDAAKYIIDRCMDDDLPLPLFCSQSSNLVGKENIITLLTNFKNNYNKQ